jgi:hypothetical protein
MASTHTSAGYGRPPPTEGSSPSATPSTTGQCNTRPRPPP